MDVSLSLYHHVRSVGHVDSLLPSGSCPSVRFLQKACLWYIARLAHSSNVCGLVPVTAPVVGS